MTPRRSTSWPLTGRDSELRYVADVLAGAEGLAGIVIAGPSGIGKTRLARAALHAWDARRAGSVPRWVGASASARTVPLGAFCALLTSTQLPRDGGQDPAALLCAAASALCEEDDPLVIDDAHLLDDVSAALVHQLAVGRCTRLVVTMRSGAGVPDAVTALWKDGLLARLDLQPLSVEDVGRLVVSVLGGEVDEPTRRRLHEATCGNVLLLRHLVDDERVSGRLRRTGGLWRWRGELVPKPPLAELVTMMTGGPTGDLRAVVELVAIAEPLPVRVLAAALGPMLIDEAEAEGLITVRDGGVATLAHPLHADVLRAGISPARVRRMRSRLADAITGPMTADDMLWRAVLSLGSDAEPDVELLGAAATHAAKRLDLPLAERLAAAAVAAGGGFEHRLVLCHALGWQGRADAAELAALAVSARTATDGVRSAAAEVVSCWTGGRRTADDGVSLTAGNCMDGVARVELLGLRAGLAMLDNRLADAAGMANEVLDGDTASDWAVSWASWALTVTLGRAGCADGIAAIVERGRKAAAHSFETVPIGLCLAAAEVSALRLAGHLDQALRCAEGVRDMTAGVAGVGELAAGVVLAEVVLSEGHAADAAARLRSIRLAPATADPGGWAAVRLIALAQALAMAGSAQEARATLSGLGGVPDILVADLRLAQAWGAAAEGVLSEAIRHARAAACIAADAGQAAVEVEALHTLVRFGSPDLTARLADLAGRVDGPRVQAAMRHAGALASDDGAALVCVAERWEDIGALLLAADAAAQAAEVFRRSGQRGRAHGAMIRAQRLAERCGGVRTPALVIAAQPLPLTRREREIVALAAADLSNQDIADRLVVSVRTIEGHLYRASAKLGVTRRAALATMFGTTRAGPGSVRPEQALSVHRGFSADSPGTVTPVSGGLP